MIIKEIKVKNVITKSNLRGSYRAVIMDYIKKKHPALKMIPDISGAYPQTAQYVSHPQKNDAPGQIQA